MSGGLNWLRSAERMKLAVARENEAVENLVTKREEVG